MMTLRFFGREWDSADYSSSFSFCTYEFNFRRVFCTLTGRDSYLYWPNLQMSKCSSYWLFGIFPDPRVRFRAWRRSSPILLTAVASEYFFQLRNFWKHCRWQCFEIPWKCIQLQIRRHSKQKRKFIWFSHASLISHIHCFDSTFLEFENIAAGNVFPRNVFSSETKP